MRSPSKLFCIFFFVGTCLTINAQNLERDLLIAAQDGDLAKTELLLSQKVKINKTDEQGRTALMFAAAYGHADIVNTLLAKNANMDVPDKRGFTAILYAAVAGHPTVVETLLRAKGSKIDERQLPIIFTLAVLGRQVNTDGQVALVNKLIDIGVLEFKTSPADPYYGKTVLFYAKTRCHDDVTKILEAKGIQFDETSASELAAVFIHGLVVYGYPKRPYPSDYAIYEIGLKDVWSAAERGDTPALLDLIHKGTNVNAINACRETPLLKASENEATVRALLEAKADVNAKTSSGVTTLMMAVKSPAIVQALLAEGADVSVATPFGKTALMFAADEGNPSVVQALIQKGADVKLKDGKGRSALDYANSGMNLPGRNTSARQETIRILAEAGAK